MSEFTSVADYFRERYQLDNKELLAEIEEVTEVRRVKEGEILMTPGEVPPKILFQAGGITRCYFYDERGREHTESFSGQYNLPIMPPGGLGEPSGSYIEVLKPGIILAVPEDWVQEAFFRYREIQLLMYQILAESAKANSEIRKVLYLYNARQRYEWFKRRFPDACACVSQKHAASFLNMSAETYCRIKREYENSGVVPGRADGNGGERSV